ncbi:MAG: hypothetical protein FWE37_01280 [Spirochaetaceae bacterium]|nr:hypothetical protein [Spirochaetaceae bacterium]
MKKLISLFFLLATVAHSQNLNGLLTPYGQQRLNNQQSLAHASRNHFVTGDSLIFNNSAFNGFFSNIINQIQPTYLQQILYVEPAGLVTNRPGTLQIYNSLLNLSSLEQAHIMRDRGTSPLFRNIRIFTDENFRNEIRAIPAVTTIPNQARYFVIMRDERFGNVRYSISFSHNNGSIGVNITNLERVRFMLWTVAESNGLSISFTITPTVQGYVYAAQVAANVKDLDNVLNRIHLPSFFSRRIEGIKGWLFSQLFGLTVMQGIHPTAISLAN